MRSSSLRSFLAYRLGAARWIYYYKGQKLKRILSSRPVNKKNIIGDCIVVANNADYQNGGLCDCLHGIVSAYYIAKKYNRQFRICYTAPFNLLDYLQPNLYDWQISPDQIDYRSSVVRIIPMMLGRFHATWSEERAFHFKYLSQVAQQPGIKIVFTNSHLCGWQEFSNLFSELFRPSRLLQQQIDYHLSQIGGPYLGASFRFRNLLGDVYEPDSIPKGQNDQNDLIRRCIEQIEALHTVNPNEKILVTSDSELFCSSIQFLPYVYCAQGRRGHISYHGTDTVMSSFLDLLLLSKSQGNTLYITDQLYRSGFAMTASFIGNTSYRESYF